MLEKDLNTRPHHQSFYCLVLMHKAGPQTQDPLALASQVAESAGVCHDWPVKPWMRDSISSGLVSSPVQWW